MYSPLRYLVLIILPLVLTGCIKLSLGGKILGLEGELSLTDGLGHSVTLTESGDFTFEAAEYEEGQSYSLAIAEQPAGQECVIYHGSGTFANAKVDDIRIYCRGEESAQTLACTEPTEGATFTLESIHPSFGAGHGLGGFSTFDSDADGYPEILFADGSGFGEGRSLKAIEFNPDAGTYQPICSSTEFSSDIKRLIPFSNDTINDGSLMSLENGDIILMDHNFGTRTLISSLGSSVVAIDMLVDDIDNDGADEIVMLTASETILLDANTFTEETTIPFGASAFASGYLLNTSERSLAYNTGYVVTISDEAWEISWDYSTLQFSNQHLTAGDIDGDGLDEIVAADAWYSLRAFNADTQGYQLDFAVRLDISTLAVFDTNGDGISEILYADAQHGNVYAISGIDGSELLRLNNPSSGVAAILVADLDQDTQLELLWSAGHRTTGPDYIIVHDLVDDLEEYRSTPIDSSYFAVTFGDLNGDGAPDQVFASMESQAGRGDGIVTAIAYGTGEVLWQTGPNDFDSTWTGVHAVAVSDIDGDGQNEVLVGTDSLYDGTVYLLDGATGEVEQQITLEDGSPIYSIAFADVDNDGVVEVLAGGGKEHTGSNGVTVYVIEGDTLQWTSRFPYLNNNWHDLWTLEVADIDDDGTSELITISEGAFIIDPDNNGLNRTVETNITAASAFHGETGDLVYLGTTDGNILQLNADASTTAVSFVCFDSVNSIRALDAETIAFTCAGNLGIYSLTSGEVEWQFPDGQIIDTLLGLNNSIAYASIFGERHLLIGGSTVYHFAYKP